MTSETETVTVFTKTICSECDKTKALLDELGVPYETVNIETTPGVLAQLKALNFRSAPVVFARGESWAGHQEDKLRALAE